MQKTKIKHKKTNFKLKKCIKNAKNAKIIIKSIYNFE